jgi:4-aminobutyrate aminotransferase-like enzyme
MTSDHIASAKPWSSPSGSSSSYGGNPLASAAGAAALSVIDEEDLVSRSRSVGAALLESLRPMVERYPFVGLVDGRGLLLRLELVADKRSKRPISRRVAQGIFGDCLRRGLLTLGYAPSLRLQPSLTIDLDAAQVGVGILFEVFDELLRRGGWDEQ